jgi:hypothetical protein
MYFLVSEQGSCKDSFLCVGEFEDKYIKDKIIAVYNKDQFASKIITSAMFGRNHEKYFVRALIIPNSSIKNYLHNRYDHLGPLIFRSDAKLIMSEPCPMFARNGVMNMQLQNMMFYGSPESERNEYMRLKESNSLEESAKKCLTELRDTIYNRLLM